MIPVALLEAVDLAVADIVVHVGQRGLGGAVELAPAALVLGAVEVERAGQQQLHRLAHLDRVELAVDVERHGRLAVRRRARNARHPVVLGIVDRRDVERVFVELRVRHCSCFPVVVVGVLTKALDVCGSGVAKRLGHG